MPECYFANSSTDIFLMNISIPGPAGNLEGTLNYTEDRKSVFALLCHPHPMYGGSMHDGILDVVEKATINLGINTIRFNFRGTGKSDGTHSGTEEYLDIISIGGWLEADCEAENIILIGYSFGASMAWKAEKNIANRLATILIAPPTPLSSLARNEKDKVQVISGDLDPYCELDQLSQTEQVEVSLVLGANHFFSGKTEQLQQAIIDVIEKFYKQGTKAQSRGN